MARALTDLSGGADRHRDAVRAVQAGVDRYGAGDLDGSAAELRRGLRLWPDHPRAALYLGWVQRAIRLRKSAAAAPTVPKVIPPPIAAPPAAAVIESPAAATPPSPPPMLLDLEPEPPAADAMEIDLEPMAEEPILVDLAAAVPFAGSALGPGPQGPPPSMADLEIELDTAEDTGVGDLGGAEGAEINLADLVAEAAQWSEGASDPPSLDEAGLLSLSDELLGPKQGPAAAKGGPAAKAASLSAILSGRSAAGPAVIVPAPPQKGSGLSDLFVGAPMLASAPAPAAAKPIGEISALFSDLPDLDVLPEAPAARSFGDLPPPLLDNLPLSDEPAALPPDELLADDDIELMPSTPPPAARSPLVAEELFADLADPAPSQPSRPLVARPKASDSPDFIVDFDDVVSEDKDSPKTFPPPPPRPRPGAPLLEEAARALGRGDGDGAFRLAEQLIEQAGGDPMATQLRPYQNQLAALYEGLLTPMERVPRTGRLPKDLEPATAFLLSLLDGSMSIEDALTVSGMDRLRGARALVGLLRRGLLSF